MRFSTENKARIVIFDFFNSPFVVIEHGKVTAMGAGSKWVELAYFRKDRLNSLNATLLSIEKTY